jgi:phosphopantetheinyl transferase
MPLVYQQNINETAKIGVWQIKENEQFFLEQVSAQKEITHPHKRLQHLAGRYLLKQLDADFPLALIKINSSGKPFIENDDFHFSISHCGDYAAAIISKSEHVGIDIEIPDQRIEKIKNKFTSEKELELFSSIDYSAAEKLTIIWSIKEAMFKWYGKGLIDFKKHLCIESVQINNGTVISNCFFRKNNEVQIIAKSAMIEDNILSYVIKTS